MADKAKQDEGQLTNATKAGEIATLDDQSSEHAAREEDRLETVDKPSPFLKSYTLQLSEYEGQEEYWQNRQVNDVRQSAMSQGYRPTGDPSVRNVRINKSAGTATVIFTLEVEPAQGAESDQDYEVSHAKVSPNDQAILEAAVDADVDPDAVDRRVGRENLSISDAVSAVENDEPEGKVVSAPAEAKVEPSSGNEREGEGSTAKKAAAKKTAAKKASPAKK